MYWKKSGMNAQRQNDCGRRAWADFIAHELAENAPSCWPELVATFRSESIGDVRLYIMQALEDASLPETVPFLGEVLLDEDERLAAYAERALRRMNTPAARNLLWDVTHRKQ
jgi:HEAT repeat protein